MLRWFGPNFDAPFYTHDIQRIPTPVGVLCARCDEPIARDEFGVCMDGSVQWDERCYAWACLLFHDECHVRSLVGCVEHQIKGVTRCRAEGCTCCDDPSLTVREAAKAATNYFRHLPPR